MFSKRHYKWLAYVLSSSSTKANSAWRIICEELASDLSHDNPRFDRAKFLRACGVSDDT